MKYMKIIILCCTIFMVSCYKVVNAPVQLKINGTDFFTNSVNMVSDGDSVVFNLQTSGTYIWEMIDSTQNQVLSKEKFVGKVGNNTLNIYTKTLPQTTLTVVLMDNNNNQINKTKITIK